MYKKPLCFVDLWLTVLWVSGTCKLLPTNLESNTPCPVWPAYSFSLWPSISFYYSSSLWDLSWIPLLLGELRPVLGPSLRDLRYVKQRGWLGEEKKIEVIVNIYQTLQCFLMILEVKNNSDFELCLTLFLLEVEYIVLLYYPFIKSSRIYPFKNRMVVLNSICNFKELHV